MRDEEEEEEEEDYFDRWFLMLSDLLAEDGIDFWDSDSVREDFDSGRNIFDVRDDIKAEHAD